jgi:uncharacterized protein (TIGR00369 family)
VCGRENPLGLAARWESDPEKGEVRATLEIPEHFNGFPGTVHGGVISALLDEAAVRTALLQGGFDDMMVTAKLEVAFRKPTPTCTPVVVTGRIVRAGTSRVQAEAELRLPGGAVAARAQALLTRPSAEVAAAWEAEREHFKVA